MTSQQKHWRPKYCRMASLKCQMKTTNCQPSILHGAKITFRNKGEMEALSDEQKQRYFSSRLSLQEKLKKVLQAQGK